MARGLVLTADQVADELQYFHRDGKLDRAKVRQYARTGEIPGPINPNLPVVDWRWSWPILEQHIRGTARGRLAVAS